MRISLLVGLMLLSISAYSSDSMTRKYSAQIFKVEDRSQCVTEYQRIIDLIDSHEGMVVLDGGCIPYGQKYLQI